MMYDYESDLIEFWGKVIFFFFFWRFYPDLGPCILLRHVFIPLPFHSPSFSFPL